VVDAFALERQDSGAAQISRRNNNRHSLVPH
jgi:hypothetical protein